MATPRATAPAHARRIVSGSPAWKPQAMLALVTISSSALSSPSRQAPKLSPRSALRSTTRCGPGPVIRGAPSSWRRSAGLFRRQVGERGGDVGLARACRPHRLAQDVQHLVAVLAQVEQALGGVPELGRVAPPQPVGQRDVPVHVLAARVAFTAAVPGVSVI